MNGIFKIVLSLTISLLFVFGCQDNPSGPDYSLAPEPYPTEGKTLVEMDNGLSYYIIEEGSGPFQVVETDIVRIYYTGRKKRNGEIFDSSYRNGSLSPARFNLTGVIEGMRKGMLGMKIGGKRKLIIPPELAYADASENSSSYELRNDTLVFDIKLEDIDS